MSEITRFPLFWPHNVPRTVPHRRARPLFNEQSVHGATQSVLAEINRLNRYRWDHRDERVIISTNVRLRVDGLPASGQAEPADTGAAVYFHLRFSRNGKRHERPCVLSCDRWTKVGFNLAAIAKDIEAQRARERWGCTSVEQAFAGYLAIPEKCGVRPWWELLNVPADACVDAIEAAFRELAHTHHPDKGGDVERWHELQAAYGEAVASAGGAR